jgi:hypothetical protein
MSSPLFASTVFISSPFESRKCNLRLKSVERVEGKGGAFSERRIPSSGLWTRNITMTARCSGSKQESAEDGEKDLTENWTEAKGRKHRVTTRGDE